MTDKPTYLIDTWKSEGLLAIKVVGGRTGFDRKAIGTMTQAESEDQVIPMAKDLIATLLDTDESTFDVLLVTAPGNTDVYEIPGELSMALNATIEFVESLATNAHYLGENGSVNAWRAGGLFDQAAATLRQAQRMNVQYNDGPGRALSEACLRWGRGAGAANPYDQAAQLLGTLAGLAWDLHKEVPGNENLAKVNDVLRGRS